MSLSLKDVLNFEILQEAKILTKNHNLDIEIKGINVMEAPDIPNWLEGYEILLTSLYAVTVEGTNVSELIRDLSQKNVAAIFVKTKRFINEVPNDMLLEAEKYKLAIVEIPVSLKYSEIMYHVMMAIFGTQVVRLSHFKKVHNEITRLSLKNLGKQSIVDVFSSTIHNPVAIYDSEFNCDFSSSQEFKDIHSSIFCKELEYEEIYYYTQKTIFVSNLEISYNHIIVPIKIFGHTKAYLTIIEKNNELRDLDYIALQIVITVLKLEMTKDYAVSEAERNFKQELIEDILLGNSTSQKSLEERAKVLNWNLKSKYVLLMADYSIFKPITNIENISDKVLVDNYIRKINYIIQSVLTQNNQLGIIGFNKETSIIFLEVLPQFESKIHLVLEKFCTDLILKVKETLNETDINIGYSSNYGMLSDMKTICKYVQDALKIGKDLYGPNIACNFETLGLFKLLCSGLDRNMLKEYVPKYLFQLEEYDRENKTELIKTLTYFFNNDCNANKTSQALFIHYKTFYYRLNKIHRLTGIDFNNNDVKLELQVGLKIMQVLGNLKNIK